MRTFLTGIYCLTFAYAIIALITTKEIGWISAICGWGMVLFYDFRDRMEGK